MKKYLPAFLRSLLFSVVLLSASIGARASHILGAELRYKWISGLTYEITLYLYGDCGPASTVAVSSLPVTAPQVCVFNNTTSVTTLQLPIQPPFCGVEVTPVCPDSLAWTQCTNSSYPVKGVKKFTYSTTYTFPSASNLWRLIYNGNNPNPTGATVACTSFTGSGSSSAGRSASITNIAGSTTMQLIDTLVNGPMNSRGHNSSPLLTVEPTPYFCASTTDCYNPGAVDVFDTSISDREPSGDSLIFQLVPATSGTAGCGSVGGSVTYTGTAWPGQPITGSTPLAVAASTDFAFDPATGQLCFVPYTQRSVVVYNIREFRHDTFVGSMQREMTFLVLTCTTTAPSGGIDSASVDTAHWTPNSIRACQYSGTFHFYVNPRETDTSLRITVTGTGMPTGMTLTVTGNNTNSPHVDLSGNTSTIPPGTYTIYLTYTDSHCPLQGKNTQAFTITILPVPTLTHQHLSQATCNKMGAIKLIPGGLGKPWTIKVSHNPPLAAAIDTFHTFVDTTSVIDSLDPGKYFATIFTETSHECGFTDSFWIDTPYFNIAATFKDPTYCGAQDGYIAIDLLNAGDLDTLMYNFNGVPQPYRGFTVPPSGKDTLFNLLAGNYSFIRVKVAPGKCISNPPITFDLTNPPFTLRTMTFKSPTKCGFCNGADTLWGIHPGQLDTLYYKQGATLHTLTSFISIDSMIVLPNLCEATYDSFVVKTAGVCATSAIGPISLRAPAIVPGFTTFTHYGCKDDTVVFTNTSTPYSELFFRWYYGDGTTDTIANPAHVYNNTKGNTVTVKLRVTNTKCVDTAVQTITLDNWIKAGFSADPYPYVCQNKPITFTDTSTGTGPLGSPLTYTWLFGDGSMLNTFNASHTYANQGQYKVLLIASNSVPCSDTAITYVQVDSNSVVSLNLTDSVFCRGQGATFTGIYTGIGNTNVSWDFGDGSTLMGANPVIHSYADTGLHVITVTPMYRACPSATATKSIRSFPYPDLYLGPDRTMCPSSEAIALVDERNASNNRARWKWNTGETASSIIVTKPGLYYATVNVDGCIATDSVTIERDCYMEVPNMFSPNGDGVNDYFYPRQQLARGLAAFKMDIYNRWGQTVFQTTSIDGSGWDGKFNGQPQPEGVYIYVIEAGFKDGHAEHHQGNVTLIK